MIQKSKGKMANFPLVLEKINDLTESHLEGLLSLSQKILSDFPSWHESFPDLTVTTVFTENSTRTMSSFVQASLNLGMKHLPFHPKLSSLEKGEDLRETLMTLKMIGANLCVLRSSESHLLEQFKQDPVLPVINGGDGIHEHPTQALGDLLTMRMQGHGPEGKTVAIIGDCPHSRVCHSLVHLLNKFGARAILVMPQGLKDPYLKDIPVFHSLDKALEEADILYFLRVQNERHSEESKFFFQSYKDHFGLSAQKFFDQKVKRPIYHPGPVNLGVELEREILSTPSYMGYHQVRCGLYMRMALMQKMAQEINLKDPIL